MAAPTRIFSQENAISLAWEEPLIESTDLVVKGYQLNMDDGTNTDLLPVYIGRNRPDVFKYTVGNLTTGLPYRFSVQALDQNGLSVPSPISTFYSCRTPTGFATPTYISSN